VKRNLLFASIATVLGAGYAYACSCVEARGPLPVQVEHAVQDADFVAEVEIVSTASATETREVSSKRWSWKDHQYHPFTEPQTTEVFLAQVNVLKLWKGAATVKEISTGFGMGDCGLPFRAGQKVVVYADATDIADRVSTGSCMRTQMLPAAAEDVAVLDGLAADPLKARVFKEPVEIFSKYDGAFTLDSVDKESHVIHFKGTMALTGMLWVRFDANEEQRANGDILWSRFVPDEPFRARLPQVVDGYYPGKLTSLSVGPSDELLVAAFGADDAKKLATGKNLEVSQRVRLVLTGISTSVECDQRGYFATVDLLDVTPLQLTAGVVPQSPGGC
jgi:hypothetical protein